MDCTPDIVDLVSESAAFAPHFHLPLQHASPRMLDAMRRPYSVEHTPRLIDSIRRRMPHASIGTDLIVGFPGESDEDFEMLATYLEQLRAHAPACLSVFGSAGNRCVEAWATAPRASR